jgi:outer membrane lipoprotein-sorting protein
MNDEHENPQFESLEPPLDLAVRAVLAEPLPEEAIERVKSRAKQTAPRADRPIDPLPNHGLRRWARAIGSQPIVRLTVAAVACLAIGLWLFTPGRQTTAQAFNLLAEQLAAAKTARYDMEISNEGQPKQNSRCYYLAPGRFRNEEEGRVMVTDLAAKKIVTVNARSKRVVIMTWKGNPPKKGTVGNQFERLRLMLSKSREAGDASYERLGEKQIDGHAAVGFRLDSPNRAVTFWGDPATGYPILIETVWSGRPQGKLTLKNFEINIPLEASLFETTTPPGYTVLSMDAEFTEPREESLIEAFRMATDFNQGRFPDALDSASMTKVVGKADDKQGRKRSQADAQRLMKIGVSVGQGFEFVCELPESANARYAGNGVTRNAKDRPIFWYKPQGASKYRVIFADLSVKDEPTAPQIPGAQPIKNASQTATPPAK